MKKGIRILSLMLIAVLLVTCFAGCGKKKGEDGKVTIIVPDLILNPLGAQIYTQQLQDEFDELYGDKIEVKHILPAASSDVNDVQNISAVLLGNDAPSYVNVSSTIYMKDLYNMGLIKDISKFVKDNEEFAKIMDNVVDACRYSSGEIIGYPGGIEIPMMGFYADSLKKAGYTPETFKCETWDEYYEVVKKMNTSGQAGSSLYASEFFLWPNNWFQSNGAQVAIQNEDGTIKLNYNDEKVIETVNFMRKLYHEGLTNENIGFTDIDSMFGMMIAKSVASFTMYPTWIHRFVSQGIAPSQIVLTKYPKGPSGGYNNVMYVAGVVFNSSLTDAQLEAAIKYYSFMNSEKAVKAKYQYYTDNSISNLELPVMEGIDWWSCLTDYPEQWITAIKGALTTAKDTSLNSTGFSTYISAALPGIISTKNGKVEKGLSDAAKTTETEWLKNYNSQKKK